MFPTTFNYGSVAPQPPPLPQTVLLPGCQCFSYLQNKHVQLAIDLSINSCVEFKFIKFTD